MAKPVEYHDGARVDFDESFEWYSERSEKAAVGFAAAADEAIEKVIAAPTRFPTTFGGCRYCSLRRYPFRIVFREEPNRIVVVAVALSFPESGSVVADPEVAVFESTVPSTTVAPTATVSVKTALPGASDAIEQVTVPPVPTAGVVQPQPAGSASDTNVAPAGSVSFRVAFAAALGPALVIVIV